MNTTHAVAGIDPHKRTATVAVVDVVGVLVTSLSFAVTESGIAELLALLRSTSLSIDRVGVEGSGGLGRPVMLALAAAGYEVREVQANRTADRRKRRRRAKTDVEDAEAIARETLADPDLPPGRQGRHPVTGIQRTGRAARLARIACAATRPATDRGRAGAGVAAASAA